MWLRYRSIGYRSIGLRYRSTLISKSSVCIEGGKVPDDNFCQCYVAGPGPPLPLGGRPPADRDRRRCTGARPGSNLLQHCGGRAAAAWHWQATASVKTRMLMTWEKLFWKSCIEEIYSGGIKLYWLNHRWSIVSIELGVYSFAHMLQKCQKFKFGNFRGPRLWNLSVLPPLVDSWMKLILSRRNLKEYSRSAM